MKNKTIAVEGGLGHIKSALQQAGFNTVDMTTSDNSSWQKADMIMVTGQNENLMGIQDTQTKAPVINVHGLSAEDCLDIARQRLS